MNYKANKIVHMHHRSNLEENVTYMGEEESFGASETLGLDSLALWQQWWRCYDTYDTNQIWRLNITYITYQVKIEHPKYLSCDLGKLNGFLLKLGEDGRLGKGWNMENHEHTPKFELDWFCGWIGNLRRISMFIKYRNQPREDIFFICELWELVDD